jgi:hypothetical protein
MCIPWLSLKLKWLAIEIFNKEWEYGTRARGVAVKRLQRALTEWSLQPQLRFLWSRLLATYSSR